MLGINVARSIPQKQEHHHHHQRHGNHQRVFDVVHRRADGGGAVQHHLQMRGRWNGGLQHAASASSHDPPLQ